MFQYNQTTRLLIALILTVVPSVCLGDVLSVKSFGTAGLDISARTHERKDLNGVPCALVKLQLPLEGCKFEGNVIESLYDVSEYWVYMTAGSKRLDIKCPGMTKLTVIFADVSDITALEQSTTYVLHVQGYEDLVAAAGALPAVKQQPKVIDPQNLDLCAVRDGKLCFFSEKDWKGMTAAEKAEYQPKGVVVKNKQLALVVSLKCSDSPMTWDAAATKYGETYLPSREQCYAIVQERQALNKLIKTFGGSVIPDGSWFWGAGQDGYNANKAVYYNLSNGAVHNYLKASPNYVRTVAELDDIEAVIGL